MTQVGTEEILLDDFARLAKRARAAGVEVVYEPWEDMIHVWHFFAPMLEEGQTAIDAIGAFLPARMNRGRHWSLLGQSRVLTLLG